MGRPAGSKNKKGAFDDLDQEWKDLIANLTAPEIKVRVAEIALELDKLLKAQEEDQDLAEKKQAAKEANQVYADGKKGSRTRIRYCQDILEAKGQV